MIKKALLLAGILAVFSTTKAHPATDNDTIEVVYADTTGIDIDSIEASIDHIELDEVTVEASAWVRKADRNLLFPNAQQIKQSSNGLQLLQMLQIPGVIINPTDNSIALADKNEVSLRINGRPVDNKDIQALSPEQIVRVEYIDNPGVRYGEVGAVIDFIVKNPTSGGSFMGDLTQSVNRGFGEYWLAAKANSGKSEVSYSGWFAPRWNLKITSCPMVLATHAPKKVSTGVVLSNGTTDIRSTTITSIPKSRCSTRHSNSIIFNTRTFFGGFSPTIRPVAQLTLCSTKRKIAVLIPSLIFTIRTTSPTTN